MTEHAHLKLSAYMLIGTFGFLAIILAGHITGKVDRGISWKQRSGFLRLNNPPCG